MQYHTITSALRQCPTCSTVQSDQEHNIALCITLHYYTRNSSVYSAMYELTNSTEQHTCFRAHQVREHMQCLYSFSLFVNLSTTIKLFCSLVAEQIIMSLHAKLKVMVRLFPVLNQPTWSEDVVCRIIALFILNTNTRHRWVPRFTTQLLYSCGKSPWYPQASRLEGPQG
jgi:hypothetical protein